MKNKYHFFIWKKFWGQGSENVKSYFFSNILGDFSIISTKIKDKRYMSCWQFNKTRNKYLFSLSHVPAYHYDMIILPIIQTVCTWFCYRNYTVHKNTFPPNIFSFLTFSVLKLYCTTVIIVISTISTNR